MRIANWRIRVPILVCVIAFILMGGMALLLTSRVVAKRSTVKAAVRAGQDYRWRLTGTEVLLELEGKSPDFRAGIYALDVLNGEDRLRLLIPGGSRPVWNNSRQVFAFLKSSKLFLANRFGKCVLVDSQFPVQLFGACEPPVKWTQQGDMVVRCNLSSSGRLVWKRYRIRLHSERPEFQLWGFGEVVFPVFRLRLPMDHVPPYGSPYDHLAIRDVDIPCTDDYLVAEVSPLTPQDLRRAESRIYILGSGERLSPSQNTMLENPTCQGRRLTTLGDQTCELAPLCSPSGEWIAFTMVNFKDRYVAPAVCHSDGSGYQELLPAPVDNGRFYDFRCMGRGWVPTGPLDVTKVERRGGSSALYMWAQPHLFPIEWSEDGTYLLLGKDGRFGELLVARHKDNRWTVILVSMAGAGALGDVLRPFAAFGPCSDGVCRVIEGPAMLLTEVTETGKVVPRPISVPKEIVRWVDW